jgi:hypothetical protein
MFNLLKKKSKNNLNKSERIVDEYPSEQSCFPTENDRIAFISKSSIKERCVNTLIFIYDF